MKYSREELDNIIEQILKEMKNYDPNNIVKPNVIFILKDLYDVLRLCGDFPSIQDSNSVEYLFGMRIKVVYNLKGELFVLHNEICETFFEKIKSCKSPEQMKELLIKHFPLRYNCAQSCKKDLSLDYYDEKVVLDWLNSDFK